MSTGIPDSFEEWLDFIFKRPENPIFKNPENPMNWHFDEEWDWDYECDSMILINYMTKLFRSSENFLINRYSYEEIDQGFWFIIGVNGFMWALLDESVDWEDRKKCILSVLNLFSDLYSKHDIGISGYMWWDSVVSYCTFKGKDLGTEYMLLETVIFVIKQISKQDSELAKKSSEHGIEHILKMAESINDISIKKLIHHKLG